METVSYSHCGLVQICLALVLSRMTILQGVPREIQRGALLAGELENCNGTPHKNYQRREASCGSTETSVVVVQVVRVHIHYYHTFNVQARI